MRRERSSQLAMRGRELALAAQRRNDGKARHGVLVKSFRLAKGTSKSIASSYQYKEDFAHNKHTSALQHHGYGGFGGGAHFTMSGSRQFLKGNKVKGLVLRKAGGGTKQRQANARRANASRGGDGGPY